MGVEDLGAVSQLESLEEGGLALQLPLLVVELSIVEVGGNLNDGADPAVLLLHLAGVGIACDLELLLSVGKDCVRI